jgi:hypothetical protein
MKNLKYLLVLIIAVTSFVSCVDDENVYIEPSPWVDVTMTTINYSDGPLSSITFPNNPIPGEGLDVVLTYSSSDEILEARIYWSNAVPPVYVKDDKIKGENEPSFTQTGVTIDMTAQSQAGVKTWFYVRIATGNGEFYYGIDPDGMALDNFDDIDESDEFKDNPTLYWNSFTTQEG